MLLPENVTGHSEHAVIKQTELSSACQVKSKWWQKAMEGIGHGKRNRKEIKHGGLDHLELLQQREQHLQDHRGDHRVSMSEARDWDSYA